MFLPDQSSALPGILHKGGEPMWIVAVMALANSLPTFAPFGMGASAAMPQAKPPKGAVWKNSVSDGKSDAKKRGIPMLVFVAGEDGSPSMTETMADPAVVKLLKHFSCVYLSKGYNRSESSRTTRPGSRSPCPTRTARRSSSSARPGARSRRTTGARAGASARGIS